MSDSSDYLLERSTSGGNPTVNPPDWLPEGWTVEIKTRMNGLTAGTKDKYYKDPISGRKFRSKDAVLRHVSGQPSARSCQNVKRSNVCTRNYSTVTKGSPSEWLPPGWVTEIKTRKNGAFAGSMYKCYIAPHTGWKFYSKNQVLWYLETGNVYRHGRNGKKRSINTLSVEKPNHPTERKRIPTIKIKRCLFGSQTENTGGEEMGLLNSSSKKMELPSKRVASGVHAEFSIELKDKNPSENDSSQLLRDPTCSENKSKRIKIGVTPRSSKRRAKRVYVKFHCSRHMDFVFPTEQKDKNSSESNLSQQLEDQTSTGNELKRSEFGVVHEKMLSENRVLKMKDLEEEKLSAKEVPLDPELNKQMEDILPTGLKGKNPPENELPQPKDKTSTKTEFKRIKIGVVPRRSRKHRVEPVLSPSRVSKRLVERKAKLTSDSPSKPSETDSASTSHASRLVKINHSGKPALVKEPVENLEEEKQEPMPNFQKTLHNDPDSSLASSFDDLLSDPCLEFAFKTLTDTVQETENAEIENYFESQEC